MTKNTEPQGVREVHEIRERLYEERKAWTDAEREAAVERASDQLIRELGLRVVPHVERRPARKTG
jgi:hypothetical protein